MTTDHPAPRPDAYTDVAALAARLGITRATVRQHVANEVPWLPRPTKLGGAWVWLTTDLVGIEQRRGQPGNPNWRKAASTTDETPVVDAVPDGDTQDAGWWSDAPTAEPPTA